MAKGVSKKSLTGLSKEEEKLTGLSNLGDLDGFRSDLRKEFGADAALEDDDNITGFIKTNLDALDYLLGGGIPQGKMTEVAGREGTGKSSFAIHMLANVQKQGGLGVIIDTESGGAGDRFRLEHFGVDPSRAIISVADVAEKVFSQIERTANHIAKYNIKEPSMVIIDSVAGMIAKSELEADMDTSSFASTARVISKGIKKTKAICRETNLACLFVNQSRVKIGGMVNSYTGPEYTTPGGDALKFMAITRLFFERGKMLGESKMAEGHVVKCKVIKCKTSGAMNRVLPMRFYYDDRNYSNAGTVYDVLNDAKALGTSAWKTIILPDGSEKKFNSDATFMELFNASEENRQHFVNMMKSCFTNL
ncbi:MAG: AAA family ATPase, partial [Ignisphaera sp.]|nr:AAA family ATPase [Ignisphaera sp.]